MSTPLVTKEGRGDNSPSFESNQTFQERLGVYVGVIALAVSFFIWGRVSSFEDRLDDKIKAAVAPAEERARTAATDSRLALDRADKLGAQLDAKGVIKLEKH